MMNLHNLGRYSKDNSTGDLRAAIFSTLLLIPQSLAYASIAGLPPHIGLYAGILPLIIYSIFGTSPLLSVGPVAILSLMTASALAPLALSPELYIEAAALLAMISGLLLVLFGVLRLGALAYFLSQPVISGFISAAAIVIIIGQLRPLLGLDITSQNTLDLVWQLIRHIHQAHLPSAIIGMLCFILLFIARSKLASVLHRMGLSESISDLFAKSLPALLVILSAVIAAFLQESLSIAVVGSIPQGLPSIGLPMDAFAYLSALFLPALFIALIGYVESIAIARSLARKQKHAIDPNQELKGLGAANVASAISSGMPITGSFARSAIMLDAGARTPMAGLFSGLLVAGVLLWGSDLFSTLPLTVLAATIIAAVSGLIDFSSLKTIWKQDRSDALALIGTFISVLIAGVETGIIVGIGFSLFSVIWRASHPYIAVVGRVPGTRHYRNILNYQVNTHSNVLMLRIDENLFFGNAHVIEQRLQHELAAHPNAQHIVLVMSSVSHIDSTALEMLEEFNQHLKASGHLLHLAELKAFVLKPIQDSALISDLSGEIFLTAADAEDKLVQSKLS